MEFLKARIVAEGVVLPPDILKVDSFLNHRIDVALLDECGEEFSRLFAHSGATLVLTVEASGIALAAFAARHMGLPLVFAKKSTHRNVGGDVYTSPCYSFTHGSQYSMMVSKKYLSPSDRVLIIDDFLADGNASFALIDIVSQSGGTVAGVGIAIEKAFQGGGQKLRDAGFELRSLAVIESMTKDGIVFGQDD